MARFDRLSVYNAILADGVVPLFYHADAETTVHVAHALADGGAHTLEFTNRGDFALNVFSALVKRMAVDSPALIVGAGTIDDAPTAALFIAHGANFIVSPSFNEEVARLCNRRKIAYLPGVGSIGDIALAEEYGAEIVKMFPGESVGGPAFVKAALGPRPWSRIMPTGGVSNDESNLRAWFEAGVACVGIGSNLTKADWVKSGNYAAIQAETAATLERIRAIRGR